MLEWFVRVVLDSSVLVAAVRSQNGASNLVLKLVGRGKLRLLASPPLFLEYEDVLLRPAQMGAHGWPAERIDRLLLAIAQSLEPVEIRFHWRPQLPDPGDEIILETAVNGRADALVTHNRRHFLPLEKLFGIPVFTPGELLRRLRNE
jgi:putative PIN family toxin of toxin-antitoxin system